MREVLSCARLNLLLDFDADEARKRLGKVSFAAELVSLSCCNVFSILLQLLVFFLFLFLFFISFYFWLLSVAIVSNV